MTPQQLFEHGGVEPPRRNPWPKPLPRHRTRWQRAAESVRIYFGFAAGAEATQPDRLGLVERFPH